MRIIYSWVTTLFSILILVSCNRSVVALDYTNAQDEIPQLGNLTFRFDKPLVSDSLVNRWDSTQYIVFEPKISGRFRWEHPDELVFSPDKPLLPATSYKAELDDDLLIHSKFSSLAKHSPINFHTPNLQVVNTFVSWVVQDENTNAAIPQMDITFNYPVNPTILKEKLTISLDGKPLAYNLQTLSADNKMSIRLLNIKMEDKDLELNVTIDKVGYYPKEEKTAMISQQVLKPLLGHPIIYASMK